MMKIAIIEDRIARLEQYSEFELKKCKSVCIITGSDFDNLTNYLKNNNTESLNQYQCIVSHRSAFSNDERDLLKKYCKENLKPLVFFSGGITSSVLKDIDFPFLHINSKEFYSDNLRLFIKDCEDNNRVNLLILQFGMKWKLSLLLSLRNKIAVSMNKELLKIQFPDIEIDDNELIKRVRDLNINSALISDLINDKTKAILLSDDFSFINKEKLQEIKSAIDERINDIV